MHSTESSTFFIEAVYSFRLHVAHQAVPGDIYYVARIWSADIVMSTFVCLSVCLSARLSREPHARSLPNLLCMLPMAVAQSSSGVVAISYVLPVL